MNRDEVEGVLGHEITHVANGDMVTMTLLQGVVNAFVLFFARVIAFAVSQGVREESRGMVQFAVIMVLQIVLSLLGAIVVAGVLALARVPRRPRRRARSPGAGKMIAALERLRRTAELVDTRQEAIATLKIDGAPSRFAVLFASHPPLEERIARLAAVPVGCGAAPARSTAARSPSASCSDATARRCSRFSAPATRCPLPAARARRAGRALRRDDEPRPHLPHAGRDAARSPIASCASPAGRG